MIKLGVSDPTLGLSDLQLLCNLMKKYVSFAQMASYLNEKKNIWVYRPKLMRTRK